MTKTHWVAIAQLALSFAGYAGLVPQPTLDALGYLVTAAFSGTLLHRGWKLSRPNG